MKLDWYINIDHFAADTSEGQYTVGDWGNGIGHVQMADGTVVKVTFNEGRTVAQAYHDALEAAKCS